MKIRYLKEYGWYFLMVNGKYYGKYNSYCAMQDVINEIRKG